MDDQSPDLSPSAASTPVDKPAVTEGVTKETKNPKMMAAIAYFLGFVTGIILLLVEKENKLVRFHAMQSTILFGGIFVVYIVLSFLPFYTQLSGLLSLASFVLWLVLMYKAYQGEMYKLPYIGGIAEKQLENI